MTEEKILLFQNGDVTTFNEVFDFFYERILLFSKRLTNSAEDGEEITISAFQKLWERKENFNTLINIQAFLYITARNACLNFLKSRKKFKTNDEYVTHLAATEKNAEHRMIGSEVLRAIDEEVQQLPNLPRQVFILKFYEDMKTAEIAAKLNISENAVRVHASMALKLLRSGPLMKKIQLLLFLAISLIYSFKKNI